MENKQRLFIYDRKEILVLLLLTVLVAAFAFTLGVHLGKRIGPKPAEAQISAETHAVEGVSDQTPHRQEIQEQAKVASHTEDESLNQALHDEVARMGIKLEVQRQVDLPQKTKEEQVAEGNGRRDSSPTAKPSHGLDEAIAEIEAARRQLPPGDFTLEVGSSTSLQEAKDQVDALEALGMRPVLQAVGSPGKEKRFRVYLGGYPSKAAADTAGEKYRNQHVINYFVVVRANHSE